MNDTPEQDQQQPPEDDKRYWLDDLKNVNKIFVALVIVCAGLIVADLFYHKHAVFDVENWFGFYGIYAFFLSMALVLAAKQLGKFLVRDKDYYDG